MVSPRALTAARLSLFVIFASLFSASAWADTPGIRLAATPGIRESTASIMQRQAASPPAKPHPDHELEYPDRRNLPQNPNAPAVSRFPAAEPDKALTPESVKIHTTLNSFDGATLTDTGAFPPDSMGTVGPSQYIVFVNGRIRSFTKAGVADGVINADPDVFFASVETPVSPPVVLDFTSDPQIRYDRFTARWYMSIIDVPCTNATCTTTAVNRWMVAVSDAASAGVISGSTVWTFFFFSTDASGNFCDYPSLGIDVNALYVGCNIFSGAGAFVGTNGYVVQKTSTLGAGPIVVTSFPNLAAGAGAGPESPRGVDNFDPGATEGYFVGPDNAAFSTIQFRRVSNPGSLTPTISANIPVTVPTTTISPANYLGSDHLGNTGGANGRLDAIDDRFFQAMIRNGRLWSAQNFTVLNTGVANTGAQSRWATRWYEFQNLTTTPTLVQSGTVFDNLATRAGAKTYWMPSVVVTGQGHAVLGTSMAGTTTGATPVYVGRLAGDALGTMTGPPAVAAVPFGTTTSNYNPPADPGGPRRWGDYSFTVVDPIDDMSVCTIQEYNQALNLYAVRVGCLAAPPPATPTCSGSPISFTGPTGNVVITATSSGGSGFYDPGANLPPPALPFSHINATVTNATVNSVTFNSPTQVTLNITALVAGSQNVTITNPDGQSVTANGCINVSGVAAADLGITKTDGVVSAVPGGSVTYTITASNASATGATGATVADTFPAVLTCTWTCTGAGGGTCAASGSGNINDATVNLPAGASVTYTATCAIAAAATGTLSNTATVTLAGDPNAANNSATDTDTLTPQANLGISKTDGVTTATPGGSVTYTITASNAGPSNAPGSSVADTFPASLTCTWTCVGAGGGTCTAAGSGNIGDTVNLPSGGSVTYTASCNISAAATGTLTNTATVATAGGITDPTPGNNSATDSDTLAASANLGITKTDGVTTATPGGSVTYTITASNAGPSNATGATVADTFPASLTCTWTCVGAGGGTCTASGSGNINGTVNLPNGGSVTYTASCNISAAATGTLSNTATVTAPAGVTDPTPGNNSATDSDGLGATADLAITKTDGVTTATPGGSVTYTITASNAGPSSATGATVADTFPASLTCTWTCVGAGGGTCTASGSGNINGTVNLPSGGSVTYTASCTISAAATGTLSNTSTVTAPAGVTDPTPGNNSATDSDTLTASADFSITKVDGVTTATPGGSVTYTIVASNAGPSNATGATVADTFPASLTCTWTCTGAGGGTCTASGSGNINDTVNLPSGSSVTYTASCTISPAATGTLTNTATVTAPAGVTDPNPGNNSATDGDSLTASANLGITKTDGVTSVAAGGSVTYTIVASNLGPSNAAGTTVTDTFPASLTCTWTCAGTAGGTCTASGSGNINGTVNLPSGGSVTYTASCTLSNAATGTLSNTATVTAPAGVTDPTPGNNSATDTDTITSAPGALVSGTKTAAGTFTVGSTLTYTVTLTNSGTGAQGDNPGNEFTDVLPPKLALVSATASSGTAVATTGTNTVTWNGAIPAAGGSVTITITATILPTAAGMTVSNQGTIAFDADGNGTNESTAQTDDPGVGGTANPTNIAVPGVDVGPIPTLSTLGLVLLGLILAGAAFAMLKRRKNA
ncbi:MAG TPA: IPTL-CTERM sorting domain-containing protein [Thermoanaerobaculia bacterium]|nr:IPTL-CTERM sorting domain-containing protein [Thermoanaerobaculia bacterium]